MIELKNTTETPMTADPLLGARINLHVVIYEDFVYQLNDKDFNSLQKVLKSNPNWEQEDNIEEYFQLNKHKWYKVGTIDAQWRQ